MDKKEVICNAELCPKYFYVDVFVLAVVFRQQFSKNRQFWLRLSIFLKTVGEIQQLVRKRSLKIYYDVILHYISLPICPLHFPKFCPIQKQKTLRSCWYLVKTNLIVYLIIYKFIFFETLIIFLESTIKLIKGIFDFQK